MPSSMTWREFRKLAEAAQGTQSEESRIVKRGDRLDVEKKHAGNEQDLVIELASQPIPPKVRQLKVVLNDVVIEGTTVKYGDVFEIADAVFWSMAAVQKFLIPYYAGFEAISVLEKLEKKFQDPNVLVILHLPRSEPSGGGGGGGGFELMSAIRRASDRAGGATLFAAVAGTAEGPLTLTAIL